jgi:DNA-binding XRE family transcriptional regulator
MLTGFQLRAARAVLDLFNKDLAQKLGLHHSTLVRLEENTPNLSYLKCNLRTLVLLTNYFESQQIIFSHKNNITLKIEKSILADDSENSNLTRFQLKAVRIGMRLTQKELGEYIGFPQSTLSELESNNKNYEFLKYSEETAKLIKSFFTANGIVFADSYSVMLLDDPITLLDKQKKLFDIDK